MPSKLAETTNLLLLHTHACGRSEVPPSFHLWAMLSAIAAAVADRVWITFQGEKFAPNLYTLLIGDAISGKGTAINRVMKYFPEGFAREGPISGQGLMQYMARQSTKNGLGARPYLVMEELLYCVGNGKQALDFVAHLTGLWEAKDRPTEKETVTGGRVTIKGSHCINLLGGTTKEWWSEIFRVDDLKAGPGRRFCVVEGQRDPDLRITEIAYPPDRAEVIAVIQQIFGLLFQLEGEMTKTPQARMLEDAWYMTRAEPLSDDELSMWRHVQVNANKLAIILALADGAGLGTPMEGAIRMSHMQRGIAMAEEVYEAMSRLLDIVRGPAKGIDDLNRLRRLVAKRGTISKRQALSKSGMPRRDFEIAVSTLAYLREIDVRNVWTRDLKKQELVLFWTPEDAKQ